MRRAHVSVAVLATFCALLASSARSSARAAEGVPEGRKLVGLEVFPEAIELGDRYDYRQIVVIGHLDSTERVDLTRDVDVQVEGDVVGVSPLGKVTAKQDGKGRVVLRHGEVSASIPVTVSGVGSAYHVSFINDVMPVMSRLGCNQGTCHGSQGGQNGFKLSLRGYDALYDHRALIDDLEGRRFNRAAPDRSLFLMKASGGVPHVGGVLTKPGESYYEKLRSWVAEGVPIDLETPRVAKIEVWPQKAVIPLPGMRQQMAVVATFTDGRVRDVTHEAFLESSDTEITKVSREGIVAAVRRGEAAILARYEGRYAATPIYVMGDRSGFEWQEVPEHNYVDNLVYRKLREVKTLPSGLCTDAEFVRRVHLDLTGLVPTSRQVRAFLADRRPSRVKREELVDRLIGSADFVEYWTNKWSDLLQVNRRFLGEQGAEALRSWIETSVASNRPYDEFVHELLTASGSTLENPPAAYYKVLREPDAVMENTTQLFLGVRFNCNKCHDHPFERWTQGNYWELASWFAQIDRKNAPGSQKLPNAGFANTGNTEELISDASGGEVQMPNGLTAQPRFPYTHEGDVVEEGSRRDRLASWLTAPENPYFAKSYVNRVWSYLLGVGFIEPVDDIRAGNPATNPELLDRLTKDFIANGFDSRWLIRTICRSRTYQHSIETNRWNEDDTVNFSHATARRLTAEQLFDAIHRATGTIARLPGQRLGTRAAELLDPSVKTGDGFLDLFGRPPRESACECERTSGMSLGQALNLVNGPTFANAISDPGNAIANLIEVERNDREVVEELFLSFLSREPTEEEYAALVPTLSGADPANVAALPPAESQELTTRFERWKSQQIAAQWSVVRPGIVQSTGGATFTVEADGSILVGGESPDTDTYTIVGYADVPSITGIRLTLLPHDSLPAKGPGRAENGNVVLSEMRVSAVALGDVAQSAVVKFGPASQTFTQSQFSAAQVVDGKDDDKKGWAISDRFGAEHRAVFELAEDIALEGSKLLVVHLDQKFGGKHTIGRFRLEVTSSRRPVRVQTLPQPIVDILVKAEADRTEEERARLLGHFLATDGDMQQRIRASAVQDLSWALANSPAFLFNR